MRKHDGKKSVSFQPWGRNVNNEILSEFIILDGWQYLLTIKEPFVEGVDVDSVLFILFYFVAIYVRCCYVSMENLHFIAGMKFLYYTDFADTLYNLRFKNATSLSRMSRQIVCFLGFIVIGVFLFKFNIFSPLTILSDCLLNSIASKYVWRVSWKCSYKQADRMADIFTCLLGLTNH